MVNKAKKKSAESMAARSKKIKIGDGAIVTARSVLTADVPPHAIVGGVPAKIIRYRFDPAIIAELLRLEWWKYGLSALDGVDFTDIEAAIDTIDRNINAGHASLYLGPLVKIAEDGNAYKLVLDPDTGELSLA